VNSKAYTIAEQQSRVGVRFTSAGARSFKRVGGGMRGGGGGLRGKVAQFTSAARKRMRERLLEYEWKRIIADKRVLWCTFTLREGDTQQVKNTFDKLLKRLEKRLPFWCFWRLEYQARGVAHVHTLLIFNCERDTLLAQRILARLWIVAAGVTSAGEVNALGTSQSVKLVKSIAHLACYISDMGKGTQAICPEGEAPGRWWGVRNKRLAECDLSEAIVVYGVQAFTEFKRHQCKLRNSRNKRTARSKQARGVRWRFYKCRRVRDCTEFFSPQAFMAWLVGEDKVADMRFVDCAI